MTAPEPLRLTLEEALAELGERNWGLRRWTFNDAPDWWQVMDGDGGVHGQGRAWPESVSVALGRPVVERDDTAELVELRQRLVSFDMNLEAANDPDLLPCFNQRLYSDWKELVLDARAALAKWKERNP